MKAVVFLKIGGPEELHVAEIPAPIPEADEILVDVHAASINGADYPVAVALANAPMA